MSAWRMVLLRMRRMDRRAQVTGVQWTGRTTDGATHEIGLGAEHLYLRSDAGIARLSWADLVDATDRALIDEPDDEAWTPFRFSRYAGTGDPDPDHQLWGNNLFTVNVSLHEQHPDAVGWCPPVTWLSIHRHDRQPIRDWRHLQRIKNELVGPSHEAIEIYPADDRLVDTANEYHLWCFEDETFRLPIGFTERLTMTQAEVDQTVPTAVQRDPQPD